MDSWAFAKEWENGWNSHDLDRILSHYREDIVFRSQKARALVGAGEVIGKAALRDYWTAALNRQPDLRFEILNVFEGHQMLVIEYRNHKSILATETLYFDAEGLVYQAAACHQLAAKPESR
ncbi:MAG: nuclear transport factor 2 family protein [Mangrovicoccus sp.]